MGEFAHGVMRDIRDRCKDYVHIMQRHQEGASYLDSLQAHRSQCLANLRDSKGSDMEPYWQLRISLIDEHIAGETMGHWSETA